MAIIHIQKCRVCGNDHLEDVIDIGEQYIQGAFEKEGVATPPRRKVPNKLVRCDTSKSEGSCGLVQTKHSIDPELLYRNYWYESGISETMRSWLSKIVDSAIDITGLKRGKVLDIASNDNSLLRNYRSKGDFKMIGVDPSSVAAKQNDADIEVFNECYPTDKLKTCKDFDIITTIACFYDVHDPVTFAKNISWQLKDSGIWIFEVAYWPTMVEKLAYDQILAEHINHYHLEPLEQICQRAGLKIFRAEKTPTNGGSILCFATKAANTKFDTPENASAMKELRFEEFNAALDDDRTYANFRYKVDMFSKALYKVVSDIKADGKTIHILGASTKMNVILERAKIGPELIPFAAERSPDKFGAKTLSGIQILSEEQSRALKPDYYLVGPYSFKDQLIEREKEFIENGGGLIFPLPKLVVVTKEGETAL